MITNAVSQACKAVIPAFIYPSDSKKGEVETTLPNGKLMKLHIRDVDIENVNRLRKMESIIILDNIEDVERVMTGFLKNEETKKK